ncbi:MAG TPA: DUF3826 domain-containing protein [Sphingomonadaceae bacterium]|nr:DUF3826 domain-containing protein [Sphingomonadaceae bacterium]
MRRIPSLLRFFLLITLALGAVLHAGPPSATLLARADKIVARLALPDEAKARRVRDLVAVQYQSLSELHAQRDARLKTAEDDKAQIEAIHAEIGAAQNRLLADYLAALSLELTPAQIDQIKDGMTYSVVPKTYRAYLEMLPELTAAQKEQIHAWLIEARERALTAGTSEEKHRWFGKYKGRITNYLAAAGYDLKAAEKAWLARSR